MVKKTIIKNGKTTIEMRYYISSLELNILEFSRAIRNHWSVENKLHWHLDFTFREDNNTTVNKNALMKILAVWFPCNFSLCHWSIISKSKMFYYYIILKR